MRIQRPVERAVGSQCKPDACQGEQKGRKIKLNEPNIVVPLGKVVLSSCEDFESKQQFAEKGSSSPARTQDGAPIVVDHQLAAAWGNPELSTNGWMVRPEG